MFLKTDSFLVEERSAPILDRNNHYLAPERSGDLIERGQSWKQLVENSKSGIKSFTVTDIGHTPSHRIIVNDAERTFLNKERRQSLVRILSCYEQHFKDYHQGLSLTCGFLLLTLQEQEVADVVSVLATHPKYIPEYWRAEAIAAARDAYVWEYLLQKHFPDVAAHFKKSGVLPETFCQKWFIGLTINVLPYKALFLFFEQFLTQGYVYLFKFGLSLVSTCKQHILESKDYEIFQILRNDKELEKNFGINDDMMVEIVDRASNFKIVDFDIHSVREKVFKEKLEERLKAAALAASKHSEEDENSESDSESGTACDVCDERAPDMWCLVCKKMICEDCHTKNAGGHSKKHKVDENWSKYEEFRADD